MEAEHTSECVFLSWQNTPPALGGGLLQVRVRVRIPDPHVTIQLPQVDHVDQPPFTEIIIDF